MYRIFRYIIYNKTMQSFCSTRLKYNLVQTEKYVIIKMYLILEGMLQWIQCQVVWNCDFYSLNGSNRTSSTSNPLGPTSTSQVTGATTWMILSVLQITDYSNNNITGRPGNLILSKNFISIKDTGINVKR